MEAIKSPLALELARETKRAVAPDEFVSDTIRRERGLSEIQAFLESQKRKAEQNIAEIMIVTALQGNTPSEVIEAMRKNAGITVDRIAELKKQAQAKQT